MGTVIRIEHLTKRYVIDHMKQERASTLREDISRKFAVLFRQRFNQLPVAQPSTPTEEILALRDINIKIRQGEKVGIIGRNGAGKSTLLKILSRITAPTDGKVSIKGRVASLLEVGTGFHPELTGRENIFLNGAILGLKREEIKARFDEIIAFSEIEKFLDTPVKRYSSGMYARLAFSVAAHLEPDILIIDEVLAVGDAQFQKKCLGKLSEASDKEGRTVLFVSHNLQAVQNLCSRAVHLKNGIIIDDGHPKDVINSYIKGEESDPSVQSWDTPELAPGNDMVRLKSLQITPQTDEPDAIVTVRTPVQLDVEFWCFLDNCNINVNVRLYTVSSECVFDIGSHSIKAEKGIVALKSVIPGNLLNNSAYSVSITVVKNNAYPIYSFANCITFEVEDIRENMHYFGPWPGIIRPQIDNLLYIKEPVDQI